MHTLVLTFDSQLAYCVILGASVRIIIAVNVSMVTASDMPREWLREHGGHEHTPIQDLNIQYVHRHGN